MITQVTRFTYAGKDYATFEKAHEAAESALAEAITKAVMVDHSIGHREAFRVCQAIIANKEKLRALMDYPTTLSEVSEAES